MSEPELCVSLPRRRVEADWSSWDRSDRSQLDSEKRGNDKLGKQGEDNIFQLKKAHLLIYSKEAIEVALLDSANYEPAFLNGDKKKELC